MENHKYEIGQWKPELREYYYYVTCTLSEEYKVSRSIWLDRDKDVQRYNEKPLFRNINDCKEIVDRMNNRIDLTKIETDNVNHPSHYTSTKVEVIDTLQGSMSEDEYLGFLKGNVIKYVLRAGKKQNTIEDLNKAIWYINKIKEIHDNE